MSAIGSLVFCTDCGNLLEPSKGIKDSILKCECCGTENKGLSTPSIPVVNSNSSRHCLENYHYDYQGFFLSLTPTTKTVSYPDRRAK